jgi:hypothetical protein
MPYDPYINPNRTPATGKYKWVPSANPSGGGNYLSGFNSMVFKRGIFRNDYFVSSSDKTLTVTVDLKKSTHNDDIYFPINNSFRKLQTYGKNVSISSTPYFILGSEFDYLITLSTSAKIASTTFKYKLSIDIYDENLLGFMEASNVSDKEQDIEKVKTFREKGPSSTIMDIDWSKYSFIKIKIYTSTDDDDTAEQFPADKSELKSTGYFYDKFDSSQEFKNTNVRFTTKANPQSNNDFKTINRIKIINDSNVKLKLTFNNIMLFNFGKVNFRDQNFPCSILSYAIPVEISVGVLDLVNNFIWPKNDNPVFSLKLFCPDDKINSRGFAHTLDVKFIIAGFEDNFGSFLSGGLYSNARVVFVGPTLGKKSSVFYLSPQKISGINGVLVRSNDVIIKDWVDKIVVQRVDTSAQPNSSSDWKSIFSFPKTTQEIEIFSEEKIEFISDYLFHDLNGNDKSWYRLIVSNNSTGLSEETSFFRGQTYTEKSTLELNTTGVSSSSVKTLIRSIKTSSSLATNKPLAVFELNLQDDFFGSSISFKKGVFKFNFSGNSYDPNFLFSSHVYLRMWFHPGSEPLDYNDPEKYRNSETEIIIKSYTNTSGENGSKIVIGTPDTLNDLLVSAPLISEINNFEIVKFTDGLIDKNNSYIPFKDQPTVKLIVGLYVHSYLNDSNNPNLVDKINSPSFQIVLDSNNTLLETPIVKNTKDALAPQRFFSYNNVTNNLFSTLTFSLSKSTYLNTSLEFNGYLEYNKNFKKIDEVNFPNSYAYEDLLALRQSAEPQKIVLKIPKYSLVDDNSIYYFVDFVTDYNSFINSKINQGTINFKIKFDLDFDNSLIINKIKIAAFFVSRYGKVTERIFISGFYELPISINEFELNKSVQISVPFYVSYNDCQIVFRVYYYPYSSTGKELTNEEIAQIKTNLNNKPDGLRINDIELTLSQGLLSFSLRNEGIVSAAINYEDLQLVPSVSLDSQQFWFASQSKFEDYLPIDKDFTISGAIYSPTWFVNLPDDMEAEIKVNFIQKPSDVLYKEITYRTVFLDERISRDEKIAATESNSKNSVVHVAKNSIATDTVQTLSLTNQINYYRLSDPISNPNQEGVVSGSNLIPLSGENPTLEIFNFNDQQNDTSLPAIMVENSDDSTSQNKIALNLSNGYLNKWQTPNETQSFEQQLLLQYAKDINKASMAFSKNSKNVFIAGYVNPGSIIVKTLNYNNPGVFSNINSQSKVVSKIVSYNYLIDGSESAVYDTSQPLVVAPNLSGFSALETFTGIAIDNSGNALICYVLDGLNNKICARMIYSTSNSISNVFEVVDMGQITGNENLNVFCPVLKFYNSMYYLVFWCSGKLFLTKFSSLPLNNGSFNYAVNPVYLIAGSSNFDTTTNKANQFFKQLYAKNKIIINKNDPSYDEVDINMQAPGLVVSNNDRFAGNIFVYYKLPSGDLVVREVTPGGLVANPIKIGD